MPRNPLWIRQEARLLGIYLTSTRIVPKAFCKADYESKFPLLIPSFMMALQIMTGLFVHTLGLLWTFLLVSQILAFQKAYLPLAVLSGFPFWAAAFFLLSGVFTVLFERRRSRSLMTCSIVLNTLSACSAVIGLLLLCLEFLAYALAKKSIWPHRAGKILSNYLFLFTLLELCVTSTLISWLYKAKHGRR